MKRVSMGFFVLLFALAMPALAQDADSDGVPDANDNCVNEPNPAQADRNFDGFGDFCDPDYWNDGTVDDIDYEIFVECFGTASPDCDLNGDGVTGIPDFGIFGTFYGGPPGPSGLACAGTIPCADPSVAGDTDSDGVADPADNCVNEVNPSQLDTDADGIGNHCDPDYDNDGSVDDVDYEIFVSCFATASPFCDLNGDGVTGIPDFGIFGMFYGGPPGPAGAGTQDSCPCSILDGNCP